MVGLELNRYRGRVFFARYNTPMRRNLPLKSVIQIISNGPYSTGWTLDGRSCVSLTTLSMRSSARMGVCEKSQDHVSVRSPCRRVSLAHFLLFAISHLIGLLSAVVGAVWERIYMEGRSIHRCYLPECKQLASYQFFFLLSMFLLSYLLLAAYNLVLKDSCGFLFFWCFIYWSIRPYCLCLTSFLLPFRICSSLVFSCLVLICVCCASISYSVLGSVSGSVKLISALGALFIIASALQKLLTWSTSLHPFKTHFLLPVPKLCQYASQYDLALFMINAHWQVLVFISVYNQIYIWE